MAADKKANTTSSSTRRKGIIKFKYKPRFNGRINVLEPWFSFMEPINIRVFYGGNSVTKNNRTIYQKSDPKKWGIALRLNVEEVCYFEFVYWIKTDLGFDDVGEIWFRKRGCSLHNGRAKIESDKDIPQLLEAPESDGYYHIYIVHPTEKGESANKGAYGGVVGFYSDSANTTVGSSSMRESEGINNSMGGPHENSEGPHDNSASIFLDANPRSENSGSTHNITQSFSQTTAASTPAEQPPLRLQRKSKNTTSQPETATSTPQQPHIRILPPPQRAKLPIISASKKPISRPQISEAEPTKEGTEVHDSEGDGREATENSNGEGDSDEEDGGCSDSEGSIVCLSENDFEDQEDDDLFNEYVDHDIGEKVTGSLGGLHKNSEANSEGQGFGEANSEGQGFGEANGDEFGENNNDLGEHEEIVDSDGEVGSVLGSDDEGPLYPEFNPDVDFKGKVELTKGLKFPSNTIFRKALTHYAIDHGFDYYFLHNNNSRVSAYCAKRCKCPWKKARILKCKCKSPRKCRFRVHCRKLKGEETWQIKSLRLKHICGWQHQNSKLTSQYLAERYLEDWRDDPTWKLKAFMKRARRECKCELGYYKAYYARERALKMIFGDADVEYERVWDYAAAIRKYNPGSTAVVKVEGVENPFPQFQRLYVCLAACKAGFVAGCRPIIGVDGAHLKGPYPGILLTAVGKDGNNNIYPVAWAVVETESSETWSWFLELVRDDIASVADSITWVHEQDELTYMSDRQKGLLDAFKTVMPNAETRYCCRHIWSNFKNKFPGVVYKEHFWKAARSSTKVNFLNLNVVLQTQCLDVNVFTITASFQPTH
ncbi:uncharacterized protein LOC104904164 [Beta vulgaris subsp. vulgaris]|uniref:uncharacterized protein LOC104904164 n=1 Tax=Beta vulgaris subsp. vulgaris TaxID=3555 RepID=UPI0020368427|nr:uncharacterized protein LOC104904164 [Beta vulgaris subsp. vulgaris]